MKKTLWLVNPAAGSGRGAQVWKDLQRTNPNLAAAPVVVATNAEEAEAELDRALGNRFAAESPDALENLVVIGGDGTLSLAANRLLDFGLTDRVALGLIPAGTGSDFARSLEIPKNPKQAYAHLTQARPRLIDVLRIQTDDGRHRYVINIASAGLSGMVDEIVNAMPQRGTTAFLRATLSALLRYDPVSCRISVEGKSWWEGPVLLFAVANGRFFGKGMKVAPKAQLDDGLADIVLIKGMPRWRLMIELPKIYLGAHLSSSAVRWCLAKTVRIEPLGDLPSFDTDGELMASGAAAITVLPGALRFLA